MDIEQGFRRFQDFGLVAGLAIGFTAIDFMAERAFAHSPHETVLRALGVASILICVLGLLAAVSSSAPFPGLKARSIRERFVAGALTGILIGGCLLVVLLT